MKKSFIVGSIALLLGSFSPLIVYADGLTSTQQINMTVGGSSLIAVDGGAVGLTLSTAGATVAGQSLLSNSVDASSKMRVSSYTTGGAKNKITATITEGSMAGTNTKLYVRFLPPTNQTAFVNYASANSLQNTGNVAEAGGEVPVDGAKIGDNSGTKYVVTLVDNMGFCWSGANSGVDGYVIEYTYASTALQGEGTSNSSVKITYTIAADIAEGD